MRLVALLAVLAVLGVLGMKDLQAGHGSKVTAAQGVVERARTQLDRNESAGQQALQRALAQPASQH